MLGSAAGGAVAAVLVAKAGGPAPLPSNALALLYELTPAETHVFELIVTGNSTNEVAGTLGIAESTLRTPLLSVFAKTGRHSRADLILLSREISLPN